MIEVFNVDYDNLLRDRERLDWLESRMKSVQGPDEVVEIEDAVHAGKSLREAIDEVRGKQK